MNAGLNPVPSMPRSASADHRAASCSAVSVKANAGTCRSSVRQPREEARIASEKRGRALDQRLDAQLPRLLQVRQDDPKDLVGVVARRADLVGADEVDEHVLVQQRQTETIAGDRAADRLDRLLLRPRARRGGERCTGRGRDPFPSVEHAALLTGG
jgi:hypothetical protein